jgi:hypothetical protein
MSNPQQTYFYPAASFNDKGGYSYNISGEMIEGSPVNNPPLAARPTPNAESNEVKEVSFLQDIFTAPTIVPEATKVEKSAFMPEASRSNESTFASASGGNGNGNEDVNIVNTPPTVGDADTLAIRTSSPSAAIATDSDPIPSRVPAASTIT